MNFALSEHMNHLQIIHGDVMKVQLPFFDVCVANLPYQVRARLTELFNRTRKLTTAETNRSRRRSCSSCWRTDRCSAARLSCSRRSLPSASAPSAKSCFTERMN